MFFSEEDLMWGCPKILDILSKEGVADVLIPFIISWSHGSLSPSLCTDGLPLSRILTRPRAPCHFSQRQPHDDDEQDKDKKVFVNVIAAHICHNRCGGGVLFLSRYTFSLGTTKLFREKKRKSSYFCDAIKRSIKHAKGCWNPSVRIYSIVSLCNHEEIYEGPRLEARRKDLEAPRRW